MNLNVRRNIIIRDEANVVAGQQADPPLVKVSVVTIIENPYAGQHVQDLTPLIEASVPLGRHMAALGAEALAGREVQSYGKAGLVGSRGEHEHANALLTTVFATPLREMIGDPVAWISSTSKVAGMGEAIDVPVNNIYDVYVRSHYDTVSLCIPGVPMPDEIAIIFCMVTRGRVNARVGGISHDEARSKRSGA